MSTQSDSELSTVFRWRSTGHGSSSEPAGALAVLVTSSPDQRLTVAPTKVDVAMFLPALVGGGAERVFLDLARGFSESGLCVEIVVVRDGGALEGTVPRGVKLVRLHRRSTRFAVPAICRYLRRTSPANVLSALTHLNVIVIVAAKLSRYRGRLIVTEHLHTSTSVSNAETMREKVSAVLATRVYSFADGVVAVSRGVADDLARRSPRLRNSVIAVPNPIRVAEIREAAKSPMDHPFFGGSARVVVAAGRLTEQKDFGTLIRAFAFLRDRLDVRLVILGDGRLRSDLMQLADGIGLTELVSLPGFVANPYPFYANASVVTMSSKWEGLPTVLLEALALQKRIVSTDCPSGPREILRDGALGTLVPVGDIEGLFVGMLQACEGRTALPGPEASAPYDIATVVTRYKRLFG